MEIRTAQQRRRGRTHRTPAELLAIVGMLTVVTTTMTIGAEACPQYCGHCLGSQLFCEDRNYTAFPDNIPAQVNVMMLQRNMIATLSDQALAKHAGHLKTLFLDGNLINQESLGPRGFKQLAILETLGLEGNKFLSIRNDTFSGMEHLSLLILDGNLISRIQPDAFARMPRLVEVRLGANRIRQLPSFGAVPSLTSLHLQRNEITTLDYAFIHLNGLSDLNLAGNKLSSLEETSFDSEASKLKKLNISGNLFTQVPRILKKMSVLKTLDISGNPIGSLPPATPFLTSPHLKELRISNLSLSELPPRFVALNLRRARLNYLYLAANEWTCDCRVGPVQQVIRRGAVGDEPRCASPRDKRGLLIASLDLSKMECAASPATVAGAAFAEDGEDCRASGYCLNGGVCSQKYTTRPVCRCAAGYSGARCEQNQQQQPQKQQREKQQQQQQQTTTHTTTTTLQERADAKARKSEAKLVLINPTAGGRAASIIVPRANFEYFVRVVEVGSERQTVWERVVRPDSKTLSLAEAGLRPDRSYRVCMSGAEYRRDVICGELMVAEEEAATTTQAADDVPTQQLDFGGRHQTLPQQETAGASERDDDRKAEANRERNEPADQASRGGQQTQQGPDQAAEVVKAAEVQKMVRRYKPQQVETSREGEATSKRAEKSGKTSNNVMYPVVGAALAAFFILTLSLMLYVCQQKKRKLEQLASSSPGIKEQQSSSTEMVPLQQQQHTPPPSVVYLYPQDHHIQQQQQYRQSGSYPLMSDQLYHPSTQQHQRSRHASTVSCCPTPQQQQHYHSVPIVAPRLNQSYATVQRATPPTPQPIMAPQQQLGFQQQHPAYLGNGVAAMPLNNGGGGGVGSSMLALAGSGTQANGATRC